MKFRLFFFVIFSEKEGYGGTDFGSCHFGQRFRLQLDESVDLIGGDPRDRKLLVGVKREQHCVNLPSVTCDTQHFPDFMEMVHVGPGKVKRGQAIFRPLPCIGDELLPQPCDHHGEDGVGLGRDAQPESGTGDQLVL